MAARPLDLEVLHRGRPEDTLQASADPMDPGALTKLLRGWLTTHKWDKGRWREFELVARDQGKSKPLVKVPA